MKAKATIIPFLIMTLTAAVTAQNTANHQRQHQTQTVNSNNSQTNSHNVSSEATGGSGEANAASGGNSFTSSENDQRQTAMALGTPTFHTSPCIKSWGAGGQSGYAGISLGGGKVDKGCDIRETAEEFRNAGSQVAFCKLMVTEPNAVKAGVSFEDCMQTIKPEAPVGQARPQGVTPPAPTSTALPQIIVPPAQVTVNIPPMPLPQVAAPLLERKPAVKHHKVQNCPTATAVQP